MRIDPVRFRRVQVISSINRLIPYGNIGSNGIVALYTVDGFDIQDSYSYKLSLNGYKDFSLVEGSLNYESDSRTPNLNGSYLFEVVERVKSTSEAKIKLPLLCA